MNQAPRYQQLASHLRKAIETDVYDIGDQLPTEHALCEMHHVSRHTARAALQILEEEQLIERRRGAGTRVISKGAPPAFVQPLGGLNELLQYARDTRFEIISSARLATPDRLLKSFGADKGKWLRLEGVRRANNLPAAAVTVFIRDSFGDKPADYHALPHAITESLRKRHGVNVGLINQTIKADILNKADATLLNTKPHTPILKTIRRYFDDTGRLFVISINRHPANWFAYEMTYKRS